MECFVFVLKGCVDVHSVRSEHEILKLLKIAHPNQISWKSGLFVDDA